MKKVLLVGKNSFIGKNFHETCRSHFQVDAISHREVDLVDLGSYSTVLNVSYQPEYFHAAYSEDIDFALRLARRLPTGGPHFFLISTRRVYGNSAPFPVCENQPLAPYDVYGTNSATTEQRVLDLLGDRCTIVRGANAFGFEPGRHTFFGLASTYLLEKNRLTFNFSPYTRRDFIPVESFSNILRQLVETAPGGIFNVGSGKSLPVGQVALWIIEGYGRGEMLATSSKEYDAFQLDISKLERLLGPQPDLTDLIRERSIQIGRQIQDLCASGNAC
jgi:dTDP-4-dehydrorhamnose reductase/UDP-glucose 4-epimerase